MKNLAARYDKYRAYKSEGHTLKEVAEHFGISKNTAQKACKGIAKQKPRNQYTSGSFDKEANAKRYVDERNPGFEYAGGFTGIDGYVDIRCKKCGAVQHRSMVSVRHGHATCDNCKRIDIEIRTTQKSKEAADKKRQRQEHHIEYAERKAKEREEWVVEHRHPCVVCGKETTNKYCCSAECSKKRNNQLKEVRRRSKLAEATVDKDITLQRLYKRDRGICYICGKVCDWGDKEEQANVIVCGNDYPSIDHVIPLANGGLHEWGNVRLAHRICNSKKSDSISPWY